ncbi:MAG: succinyl-diaminopimelate desuccinylase [Acidimicrobiales bacterium]
MDGPDLLARTAAMVEIPSVSHDEGALTGRIEADLRALGRLDVERVGANLVARTALGRATRVVLAGHTDTVPPNGNAGARIDGDVLWGLGAADMKGGLAVMVALAEEVAEPAVDVTWVFYAGEEVSAEHNGLGHLARDRPDLLAGDVAILGEPTDGALEAGCQGTMRLEVTVHGTRAHTARPWMGRNAVHRLGAVLRAVDGFPERRPVLDGCEYREALQAVAVTGGVAGNVVPHLATVTLNRRFAPDRTPEEAEAEVRALLAPALEGGDEVEVVDMAPAAPPGLDHPVLRALVDQHRLPVRAKLGWTDVARFAALGVPACNLGPGDPTLAHTAEERVERGSLERAYDVLRAILTTPAA